MTLFLLIDGRSFITFTVVAVIFLSSIVCGGHIVTAPNNTVVKNNGQLSLSCSTNDSTKISWAFRSDENHIYNGYGDVDDFPRRRVNTSRSLSTLTIEPVAMSDAGRYFCIDAVDGVDARAEVIVVDKEPNCGTNSSSQHRMTVAENNSLELLCKVNYSGNWPPVITWQQLESDSRTKKTLNGLTHYQYFTNYTILVSRLVINVTSNLTGTKYTSETHFDLANQPTNYLLATNVPEYVSTWISPAVEVAYGPRSLTIGISVEHPTVVTCSADAHPLPTYSWVNARTNVTLESDGNGTIDVCRLLQSKSDLDPTQLMCIATNYVTSVSRTVILNSTNWGNTKQRCPTTGETNDAEVSASVKSWILFTVPVSCGLILLFVIVVIRLRRRKNDRRRGSSRQSASPDLLDRVTMYTRGATYAEILPNPVGYQSARSYNYHLAGNDPDVHRTGRSPTNGAVTTGEELTVSPQQPQQLSVPPRHAACVATAVTVAAGERGPDWNGPVYAELAPSSRADRRVSRPRQQPVEASPIYAPIDHRGI